MAIRKISDLPTLTLEELSASPESLFELSYLSGGDVIKGSELSNYPSYHSNSLTPPDPNDEVFLYPDDIFYYSRGVTLHTFIEYIKSLFIELPKLQIGCACDDHDDWCHNVPYCTKPDNYLSVLVKADFTNKTYFHDETYFHERVIIDIGENGNPDDETRCPVLSTQGDITARYFRGIALSARWADLAEVYEADCDYEAGTLVCFGGDKEITIATDEANAVITTNPALVMNTDKDYEHPATIVLSGRTPVRISHPVKKFDRLCLDTENVGLAKKADCGQTVIGIALESQDDISKPVLATVKLSF